MAIPGSLAPLALPVAIKFNMPKGRMKRRKMVRSCEPFSFLNQVLTKSL
jgi:hypothetical protein